MKIFFGLPYARPDVRAFSNSLSNFSATTTCEFIYKHNLPGEAIDVARNLIVKQFLKGVTEERIKCDYLMFIDNDASWAPGSIDRLISHDKDIICGGMYTREIPPRPTIGKYMGRTPKGKDRYDYTIYADKVLTYLHDELGLKELEINENLFKEPKLERYDACGMHFTLIKRRVLEELKYPWFMKSEKTGAGEDFYFCKKAVDAGFELWTDYSVQTAHYAGESNSFGARELLKLVLMVKSGVMSDIGGAWEVEGDLKAK
jgi:GT2 family glycosyltransferase